MDIIVHHPAFPKQMIIEVRCRFTCNDYAYAYVSL